VLLECNYDGTSEDTTATVSVLFPSNRNGPALYNPTKYTAFILLIKGRYYPLYWKTAQSYYKLYPPVGTPPINHVGPTVTDVSRPNELVAIINVVVKPMQADLDRLRQGQKTEALLLTDSDLSAADLMARLSMLKYSQLKQVVGPYGQTVGIEATSSPNATTNKMLTGYIPCRPSAITYDSKGRIRTVQLQQYPWRTYAETEAFISQWISVSPSQHRFRHLAQNGTVIGFLSPSGQTIPIMPPVPLSQTDTLHYEAVEDEPSVQADAALFRSAPNGDTERVSMVRQIYQENDYYGRFRNAVRRAMQQQPALRGQIITACAEDAYALESDQLVSVTNLLKTLMDGRVVFTDNLATNSNNTTVVMPRTNLYNRTDNQQGYFRRMADELIRYRRINRFIFDSRTILAIDQTVSPLHPDEMRISAKDMPKFIDKYRWTAEDQLAHNTDIYTTANTTANTYTQSLDQMLP
jgi:hypothetical protein